MKCFVGCQKSNFRGEKKRGREAERWESIREDVNLRNGSIKGLGRHGLPPEKERRSEGHRTTTTVGR